MKYNICMASDFFYPNTGGVESHIFQLSQCLIERGHKVVIITHKYGDRNGVRYMTCGLKVYYVPMNVMHQQCVLPTMFTTFPLVRNILLREKIDIVHGHSAFSTLAHETMFHATTLGIRSVFTDHSLFGFSDASAIVTNKVLQISLVSCHRCICVSHTSKENTALRGGIPPENIHVIPNAVDATIFTPDPSKADPNKITIVVISRLVYRKGIDLLANIIPVICSNYQDVNFIIGGDGPKRIILEEVRERYMLHERIKIIGAISHDNVRDVLVKGNIFLNTSLTEAFCIAIVEAASCGLKIVSTSVGGIPEVLPSHMIYLAEPNLQDLTKAVYHAIDDHVSNERIPPEVLHEEVQKMYQWQKITKQTELVYNASLSKKPFDVKERFRRFKSVGTLFGYFFILIAIVDYLLLGILNWIFPVKSIDIAPYLPGKSFKSQLHHVTTNKGMSAINKDAKSKIS